LWPAAFLLIAYDGWFLDARRLWWRLAGPVAVILLPMAYDTPASWRDPKIVGATLYAGVIVAVEMTTVMAYTSRHLLNAQRVTEELATRDPLTGMPNRREFENVVEASLRELDFDAADQLALVMLDLDGFKNVNTRLGHHAGDRFLCEVADALAASAREDDFIARVGGDEFVAVLRGVGSDGARAIAERMVGAVAAVGAGVTGQGGRDVTASAGYALYPLHGRTLDELVNAADIALMSIKSGGPSTGRVSRLVVGL